MSKEEIISFVIIAAGIVAIYGWSVGKSRQREDDKYNRELRLQLDKEKRELHQQINKEKIDLELKAIKEKRELEQKTAKERRELEQQAAKNIAELQKIHEYTLSLRREFEASYVSGRKWLAQFISEGDRVLDDSISSDLRTKRHPALKAAEEVAIARAEKRQLKEQVKLLEYQLKSYKEYFPLLEEYEEIILDEAIPLISNNENLEVVGNADPVLFYVPKVEYENYRLLSETSWH